MSVSSISSFGNWYTMTREARVMGPDKIQNEASLRSMIVGDAIGGRATRRVIRGGTHIEERIRLARQSNYSKFRPGATLQTSRVRTTWPVKWPWAHVRNHYPLNEWEAQFNEGDMLAQFKKFRPTIDDELEEDHWTGVEGSLWKIPDSATMEGLTIVEPDPMSILAYITENTAGTYPYRPPNWGDNPIAQLSPTTYENWRNVLTRYTPGALDDPHTGIFAKVAEAHIKASFKAPPQLNGIVDTDNLDRCYMYSNDDGVIRWQNLMRSANSITRNGANDPQYSAQYMGKEIKNIDLLNTLDIDEDPTTGAYTSQAFPTGKPRYFGINWKYLFPVFHHLHFGRVTNESGGSQQPGTQVLIKDTSMQLICLSRRRQFRVAPQT